MATSRSDARGPSLRKDGRPDDRTPPFRRVLVANRGEIAVRIIRACHELGMEAVAVYSDADADAPARPARRRGRPLGPAPAAESYLRIDAIVDAALATGAEAIHPGYGFLAERAAFARAVEDAGPRLRRSVAGGDRGARRQARARGGVARRPASPVVPGTLEPAPVDRPDAGRRRSSPRPSAIGFPLLVKAAAGGGGRGMRRVDARRRTCRPRSPPGRREAAVGVRRRVGLPRARDPAGPPRRGPAPRRCDRARSSRSASATARSSAATRSWSRRRRRPGLSTGRAARPPRAGGPGRDGGRPPERGDRRVPAATPDGAFWFLEVNTRLQVEHGVTELVTGLDIVREQFWLAAGRPLSDGGAAPRPTGRPTRRATRSRSGSSAEDPARDFAPTPGPDPPLGRCRPGPGVRVDTAIEAGDRVPPDYDNLIAKIMVHADDRAAAIDRLRRALDETEIGGIQTTLPFHRFVARDAGVPGGRPVDRLGRRALGRRRPCAGAAAPSSAAAAAAAAAPAPTGGRPVGRRTPAPAPTPAPARRAGRRPGAAPAGATADRPVAAMTPAAGSSTATGRRRRPVGRRRSTRPIRAGDGRGRRPRPWPTPGRAASSPAPRSARRARRRRPAPPVRGRRRWLAVRARGRGRRPGPASASAPGAAASAAAHGGPTRGPCHHPGTGRRRVAVDAGDAVVAGQQLLVVEAMKMQNELRAPRDGIVERVAVGGRRRPSSSATSCWSLDDRGPTPDRPTGEAPDPARDRWRDDAPGQGARRPRPSAASRSRPRSGIEIRDLYTPPTRPASTRTATSAGPGEYPFTRGVQPTMYREPLLDDAPVRRLRDRRGDQPSASATCSSRARPGCRSPSTCRPRWATTRTRREAEGEVGRVGVPISQPRRHGDPARRAAARRGQHLDDDQRDGADPAGPVRRGGRGARASPRAAISGHDPERHPQGVHRPRDVHLPAAAVDAPRDRHLRVLRRASCPSWNTISISGYHMREAGATAAQELAFTLADAIAYVEAAVARGLDVDDFAGRLSLLLRGLVGAVRGGRQVPGGPPDVGPDHARAVRRIEPALDGRAGSTSRPPARA